MSKAAIDWVWTQSKAKNSHRLVMLALADHADDNGVCWPSVARLAKHANISERQVQYAIRDLAAAGEIEVTRAVGRQNTSEYRIKGAMGFTNSQIEKVQSSAEKVQFSADDETEKVQSSAEKVQSSADDAEKVKWVAPELTNTDQSLDSFNGREITTAREPAALPPSQPSPNGNGAAVSIPVPVGSGLSPRLAGVGVLVEGNVPEGAGTNAVQVYYERFHVRDYDAHLSPAQEKDLINLCPDLDRLREVVTAYSRTTFKHGNVQLILDWYRDGVPARQANTNGGTYGNAITGNGKNGNGNGWNAGGRNGADRGKQGPAYTPPNYTEEDFEYARRGLAAAKAAKAAAAAGRAQ